MKKYFYTAGSDKHGPFTIKELKSQKITRETKVWFYGLDKWKRLSDIDELKSITNSIPPLLKNVAKENYKTDKISSTPPPLKKNVKGNHKTNKKIKKKETSNKSIKIIAITLIVLIVSLIGYSKINDHNEKQLYKEIADSAYDSNVDFDFYLNKFYRDIEISGISPKKPITKIIKFAKLDQIENLTHYHGISFGFKDDDKIEIYINPSTWDKFNKPMRYYLMYHELAHDVLNVDDLEYLDSNKGKLMFPALASYENITMDDFIESSHALFEEVAEEY